MGLPVKDGRNCTNVERVKATERLGELFGTVQRLLPLKVNNIKKEKISNHIV